MQTVTATQANPEPAPVFVKCKITGVDVPYKGYGRPPLYSPEARKALEKKKRAERYAAKQAKLGKTVRTRKG